MQSPWIRIRARFGLRGRQRDIIAIILKKGLSDA
jgi:hypothetical protein